MLGQRLKLTTSFGETLEGSIFAFDSSTNTLVLNQKLPSDLALPDQLRPDKHNFSFVRVSHITGLEHVGEAQPAEVPKIGPVSVERLKALEAQRLKMEAQAIAKIGLGVSEEAQGIFDALSKT